MEFRRADHIDSKELTMSAFRLIRKRARRWVWDGRVEFDRLQCIVCSAQQEAGFWKFNGLYYASHQTQ